MEGGIVANGASDATCYLHQHIFLHQGLQLVVQISDTYIYSIIWVGISVHVTMLLKGSANNAIMLSALMLISTFMGS